MLKALPIATQTFKRLREKNLVYVDKTTHAYQILKHGGSFFLARPRRFGKSLFLSTLMELAEGNSALFEETWIEDKWDWESKFPVLHLQFASMPFQELGLYEAIKARILEEYKKYQIEIQFDSLKELFLHLIISLNHRFNKVVILIDEYDKPILDAIERNDALLGEERKDILKTFYSVLKDAEPYLHCTFITGITKFTKVSIFSDLNHLTDLTFHLNFTTAYGYTQEELETNFDAHITSFLEHNNKYTKKSLLEKIKEWYNGYSWDGIHKVYNPYSIIHFFENKYFINSWFDTATPSFLIQRMFQANQLDFESLKFNTNFLSFKSIENLDITVLMFQTGYLTIKTLDDDRNVLLDYPNREVKESMYHYILNEKKSKYSPTVAPLNILADAFYSYNLEQAENIIQQVFDDLAYDAYIRQTPRQIENFYHSIINILFRYVGLYVQSEVHVARGRADSIIETNNHIYIFEFKLDKSAKEALQQVLEKGYADKYKNSNKKITLIGANFSTATRSLDDWEIVEVS